MAKLGYRTWLVGLTLLVCLLPMNVVSAEDATPEADVESVEMFAAIDEGLIDVRVVQKNPNEARVVVENKTSRPLNVQMPQAFAAVPVVGQFDDFGGGGGFGQAGGGRSGGTTYGGGSNSSGNSGFQSTGGGFGGGGGYGGGGGGRGGFGGGGFGWNVPAEESVAKEIDTVCLEFGKKNPRSSIRYAIRPIEEVTDVKAVHAICAGLGQGKASTDVAQLAAWNLNNGVSWPMLASLRTVHLNGNSEPAFHPADVREAVRLAAYAIQYMLEKEARAAEGQSMAQSGG